MSADSFYKLRMIGGLHKDAELFLEPDIAYSIGSGDDCDIVLLDAGVAEKHLRFHISGGKAYLEEKAGPVFVEGIALSDLPYVLESYQAVTIGAAHFALGPADEAWPTLTQPEIPTTEQGPCLDLVPVEILRGDSLAGNVGRFQTVIRKSRAWFKKSDHKVLVPVCIFLIVLLIFVYDTWQSCPPVAGLREQTPCPQAGTKPRKSLLLSVMDGIRNARRNTLVGTGFAEPDISTEAKTTKNSGDPIDHIRHVLQHTWGPNLTETRIDETKIQFKGYDDQKQQDFLLNFDQNEEGTMSAKGITLRLKEKKKILSQIGDLMRVKIDVAEDMENACQRVMERKGVRQPSAKYSIDENALTLQGKSDDLATISAVRDIIAKTFPEFGLHNKLELQTVEAGKLNISSVITSGIPHIILTDGSKIFAGGKLDNGCTIVGIENDHLMLNCNGAEQKHQL